MARILPTTLAQTRFFLLLLWTSRLVVTNGSPCIAADPCGHARGTGQRVFVTGHSFHIFVADRLTPLAYAAGISGHVLVGKQMIGASRVRQHWDLPEGENPAKAALWAGKVDVLTMSPNWLVPDDGINFFTDLGIEHNPDLRILIQLSWMAFDHWEPTSDPAAWDPAKMIHLNEKRDDRPLHGLRTANASIKAVLQNQIAAINSTYARDVIHLVPVSDAVIRLRERVLAGNIPGIERQSELFTDPIGHGKTPIMALATYCNFSCIYRRSPVGLDDGDRELDRIHPKLRFALQEIAWDAVTSHPMSGVKKSEPSLPTATVEAADDPSPRVEALEPSSK